MTPALTAEAGNGAASIAPTQPSPAEPSLAGMAAMLRRSRRFLALWIAAWLLVALIVVMNLQPYYSTSALVMLNTRQLHYAEMREVLTGPAAGIDGNAVRSEVEILTSPELARRVVQDLRLTTVPDFQPDPPLTARMVDGMARLAGFLGASGLSKNLSGWAAGLAPEPSERARFEIAVGCYQKAFSAFNNGRSYVISVGFQASNPDLAASILNHHVNLYIEDQRRIKNEALTSARSWLDREVDEQATRLREAERQLQDYRERFQLYQPRGASLSAQRLADMNAQLGTARADLAEREARLQRVRNSGDAAAGDSNTDVQASAIISRLRDQEAAVRRREAELAVQVGADHPNLRATRAELAAIQRKAGEEVDKVLHGLESEVEIARAREAEVARSVAALERELGAYERNDAPAREAERQVNVTRSLYENLLARQKQVAAQEGIQQADARVVSRATAPLVPSFPRKSLLMAIAAVAAAVTGFGIVLMRERLRAGFASLAEAEAITGLRGLVTLPRTSRRRPPEWQVMRQPKSATAEAVRSLRMLLALPRSLPDGDVGHLRSIAITSAVPAEGKTSVALALARSLAGSGLRVLLIDADLRRPGIARAAWGKEPKHGLVDLLLGEATLDALLASDAVAGLEILAAGERAGPDLTGPQDLLSTSAMTTLLQTADKVYDYVVVDTPPVGPVSDAAILGRLVQGNVLVVQWGKTHRDAVQDGVSALRTAKAPIAGIVLNGADPKQAPVHGAYRRGLRAAYFHA